MNEILCPVCDRESSFSFDTEFAKVAKCLNKIVGTILQLPINHH